MAPKKRMTSAPKRKTEKTENFVFDLVSPKKFTTFRREKKGNDKPTEKIPVYANGVDLLKEKSSVKTYEKKKDDASKTAQKSPVFLQRNRNVGNRRTLFASPVSPSFNRGPPMVFCDGKITEIGFVEKSQKENEQKKPTRNSRKRKLQTLDESILVSPWNQSSTEICEIQETVNEVARNIGEKIKSPGSERFYTPEDQSSGRFSSVFKNGAKKVLQFDDVEIVNDKNQLKKCPRKSVVPSKDSPEYSGGVENLFKKFYREYENAMKVKYLNLKQNGSKIAGEIDDEMSQVYFRQVNERRKCKNEYQTNLQNQLKICRSQIEANEKDEEKFLETVKKQVAVSKNARNTLKERFARIENAFLTFKEKSTELEKKHDKELKALWRKTDKEKKTF